MSFFLILQKSPAYWTIVQLSLCPILKEMVWMLLFQNRTYILMFQSNPDKHRIPNQNRTYHFLTTNFKLFALKSKRNRLSKLIMDIQINFWDRFFLNYLEDTWDTKKFIYCKTTLEADVHLWYGQTHIYFIDFTELQNSTFMCTLYAVSYTHLVKVGHWPRHRSFSKLQIINLVLWDVYKRQD